MQAQYLVTYAPATYKRDMEPAAILPYLLSYAYNQKGVISYDYWLMFAVWYKWK